jgi:hypothetical protein
LESHSKSELPLPKAVLHFSHGWWEKNAIEMGREEGRDGFESDFRWIGGIERKEGIENGRKKWISHVLKD